MKKINSTITVLFSLLFILNAQAREIYTKNSTLLANGIVKDIKYRHNLKKKTNFNKDCLKTNNILFCEGEGIPNIYIPMNIELSSNNKTTTTIDLSWTAAPDEAIILGYKIYKDGILEATLNDNVLFYKVVGLSPNTNYNFTITSFNSRGKENTPSNTLSVTTE